MEGTVVAATDCIDRRVYFPLDGFPSANCAKWFGKEVRLLWFSDRFVWTKDVSVNGQPTWLLRCYAWCIELDRFVSEDDLLIIEEGNP